MGDNNALSANLTAETRKNLFGNADLNMLWTCPSDPRFPYWVHIPDSYSEEENPQYQLMVIIHGTGCATENYVKEACEWADKNHVAILAPLFPSGVIDRNDFNAYKMMVCDGIRYDHILLAMIEDMGKRYPGVETEKFFLFGHSGGGQYTNRFLYLHPERLKAVSIGSPGRPTFLNFEEDYFWGVKNFKQVFDKELNLEQIKQVPVQITVGECDNKFIGDSPYGTNRVERMKSLKKNLEAHEIYVELEILPGLAHEFGDRERVQTAQGFFKHYF